jgi:hypothetical protein
MCILLKLSRNNERLIWLNQHDITWLMAGDLYPSKFAASARLEHGVAGLSP